MAKEEKDDMGTSPARFDSLTLPGSEDNRVRRANVPPVIGEMPERSDAKRFILTRTGRMVPFLDVSIGQPFFAHGKVWIRTDYNAASHLGHTNQRDNGIIYLGNVCNFNIDNCDKLVEAMKFSVAS